MAKFTTRVELEDADWQDYETLHNEMSEEDFTKTITCQNGIEYQLPDAEYNYVGSKTTQEVLNKAKQAATKTKKKFKILVTKSEERKWYCLDKV